MNSKFDVFLVLLWVGMAIGYGTGFFEISKVDGVVISLLLAWHIVLISMQQKELYKRDDKK